jgi:hypothetical protein
MPGKLPLYQDGDYHSVNPDKYPSDSTWEYIAHLRRQNHLGSPCLPDILYLVESHLLAVEAHLRTAFAQAE